MQNQKKFPTSHHSPLTETKTADGTKLRSSFAQVSFLKCLAPVSPLKDTEQEIENFKMKTSNCKFAFFNLQSSVRPGSSRPILSRLKRGRAVTKSKGSEVA
ncbi:hypothetical protein TBK1r_05640 [Stieleria magnilauensis]|uniref:Uncharacterized protein n=1 Tax=Stieleria magnilauensis TaxID=2527963 RepID=A0ABX5XI30_9BACT|nr:hypothetical protein TBK1r_05640 [Planctomycetes bacterium TBK1r]